MAKKNINILFITRSSEEGGEAIFIKKIKLLMKNDINIKSCSLLGYSGPEQNDKVFLNPNFFFKKPLITIGSIQILLKEIKKVDIAEHFVFGIYSFFFFFLTQIYGKKSIVTFHTNLISKGFFRYPYSLAIKLLAVNYLILFADKALFITDIQLQEFRRFCFLKKVFDKKSIFMHNFFESKNILKEKKFTNEFSVIFAGRYTTVKGFEDLIKVADELRYVDFYLIGDNNYISNLPNVKNLGKMDNSVILNIFDKNSVLILPSYSETFGLVILEAMARGLVVLASDLATIREYFIDGRNGYLFTPGDIKKIVELIVFLKNNPREVERISNNNLCDILNFTAEIQLPKYINLYNHILIF